MRRNLIIIACIFLGILALMVSGNIIIIVLKVGLMIAGAFIFCFVSSVIMTVETAYGLFENFNWSGWFKKIKPAPKESATAMAQQNTEA